MNSASETPVVLTTQKASAALCATHLKPLSTFSQYRQQPVCEDCRMTIGLTVEPLEDAYRFRVSSMNQLINTHLFTKRQALDSSAKRLNWRLHELHAAHEVISADLRQEFSAMNGRLSASATQKLAVLNHQKESIKFDVSRVHFLMDSADKLDPVQFLLKAREIREAVDIAVNKPLFPDPQGFLDDLPNELATIRRIMQLYPALVRLNSFKDQVIGELIKAFKPKKSSKVRDAQAETERLSEELAKLQLRCDYCHCLLDPETVNEPCTANDVHYFRREQPPLTEHDVFKALRRVKKLATVQGINIEEWLATRDPTGTGKIHATDFYQQLTKLGLKGKFITKLNTKYSQSDGTLDYKLIVKDVAAVLPCRINTVKAKLPQLEARLREIDLEQRGCLAKHIFVDVLTELQIPAKTVDIALQLVDLDLNSNVLYLNFLNKLRL